MKRLSYAIGAVLVSAILTLTYAATANARGNGGHNGSHHNANAHHVSHEHGWNHYRDRGYRGWSRYCWFPDYRCYGYYCPDDGVWYYWYGPRNSYLPVSEMATNPPDNSVNAPPSLPPGATAVSYVAGNQE